MPIAETVCGHSCIRQCKLYGPVAVVNVQNPFTTRSSGRVGSVEVVFLFSAKEQESP
jgi:hypothetical protein